MSPTEKGNAPFRVLCFVVASVFFSTHVLDTAEKICNKVAMINHGRLIFSGTMEEMLQGKKGSSLEEIFIDMLDQK